MSTITTRAGKGSPLTNNEVDANFTNLNTDKAELSGAAFTGAITTTSTVDGRDVATDGSKLDGIEASADVTDTTNVTAAGALMDSEVTNLAQVKAFDSADYATAAQGTTADAALPKSGGAMTGAITTNSTFDGRDVATDGTKLDGIEASADVTDTTNVTAAGALMDSELTSIASVKALNQGVATTDSPTFAGLTTSADVSFGDNDKAIFGAGSDLQIYHSSSTNDSIIDEAGTGNLNLQGTNVVIKTSGGSATQAEFFAGDANRFYYNNALKLATTSTGIDVTGTATISTDLNVGGAVKGNAGTRAISVGTAGSVAGGVQLWAATNQQSFIQFGDEAGTAANHYRGYLSYNHTNDSMSLGTSGSTRATIDSSGNVGIGVIPETWQSTIDALQVGLGASFAGNTTNPSRVYLSANYYINSSNQESYLATDEASQYFQNAGTHIFKVAPSGTADSAISWTTAMTVDNSGRVGIGTSSPSTKLHLGGTAPLDSIIRQDSTVSGTNWEIGEREAGKWQIFEDDSDSVVATFTSSGNVGIANTSPVELLTIGSTSDTNVRALFLSSTSGAGTIQFGDGTGASAYSGYINYTHSDNALAFATGSSERMRISSAGSLMVNSTTNFGKFVVENGGNSYPSWFRNTSSSIDYPNRIMSNYATGGQTATMLQFLNASSAAVGAIKSTASATSYVTSSDQRLKENIADADDAGSKVDAIQVRQYDWKADGSHQDYGMVAQELQAVAPEAVSGDADSEDMMGVDYSKLVPMLIKEIQSLRNRVAQLEE